MNSTFATCSHRPTNIFYVFKAVSYPDSEDTERGFENLKYDPNIIVETSFQDLWRVFYGKDAANARFGFESFRTIAKRLTIRLDTNFFSDIEEGTNRYRGTWKPS